MCFGASASVAPCFGHHRQEAGFLQRAAPSFARRQCCAPTYSAGIELRNEKHFTRRPRCGPAVRARRARGDRQHAQQTTHGCPPADIAKLHLRSQVHTLPRQSLTQLIRPRPTELPRAFLPAALHAQQSPTPPDTRHGAPSQDVSGASLRAQRSGMAPDRNLRLIRRAARYAHAAPAYTATRSGSPST